MAADPPKPSSSVTHIPSGDTKPPNEQGKSKEAGNTAATTSGGTKPSNEQVKSEEGGNTATTTSGDTAPPETQNGNKDYVKEICSKDVTGLLDTFFKDPTNKSSRENFSRAVDKPILERQHKAKNTDNLLLPMARVAYLCMEYAMKNRLAAGMEEEASTMKNGELKDSSKVAAGKRREDQAGYNAEWENMINEKGYPSAWIGKLGASAKALKDGMKALRLASAQAYKDVGEDLSKKKALACKVWGVSIDDDARSNCLTWNAPGRDDLKRPHSPSEEDWRQNKKVLPNR